MRDGDYVEGGCVTGPDAGGPLLIVNPEDSFRLACGPIPGALCAVQFNELRYESIGWPKAIRSITFLDRGVHYTIELEDGRRIDGVIPLVS
jgi:hypothetical protein